MLIKLSNNTFRYVTQLDFVNDTEYYRYILNHKYNTRLNQSITTKQHITRFASGKTS